MPNRPKSLLGRLARGRAAAAAAVLTLLALLGAAGWRLGRTPGAETGGAPDTASAEQATVAQPASGVTTRRPEDFLAPAGYRGRVIRQRLGTLTEKVVALTFDDGPDPRITPQVLAALARYEARATFFVIGRQVAEHPSLIRRIVSEGHALGHHSYSHRRRPLELRPEAEVRWTAKALREAAGVETSLLRPPYGVTITPYARAALEQEYSLVLWTASSGDAGHLASSAIAANATRGIRPGEVVLLHDGPGHQATANALPRILSHLKKAGFRFVTVPELMRLWDEQKRRDAATRWAAHPGPDKERSLGGR